MTHIHDVLREMGFGFEAYDFYLPGEIQTRYVVRPGQFRVVLHAVFDGFDVIDADDGTVVIIASSKGRAQRC